MASEAKRGLVRIATNYTRLFLNVSMGLASVPILLSETGKEGWGLIAMLGATTGVAALTEETIRRSMVSELGRALHNEDRGEFTRVYNAATIVALGMAGFTLMVFGLIYLLLPMFNIESPALFRAAQWIVMFKACESFSDVVLSPAFNTYLASERMLAFNFWVTAQRVARFMSAVWLLVMVPDSASVESVIKTYAVVGAILYIGVGVAASLVMMLFVERRTLPRPWLARFHAMKGLAGVGRWNMLMTLSQNLHLRADQIVTNLYFGLTFNGVFGWAMQLTSYVRMLTMGMTDGLDAVTTRVAAHKGASSVLDLMRHSTRLHAFVALPTGIGMLILAEPVLRVWLGARAEDPEIMIPLAVPVMQVIVLGTTARAVSDGWIRILYGAGYIRQYAKPFAFLSVFNPIIAVALSATMPEGVAYLGPPIAFAVVTLALSGVLIPIVGARCLGVRPEDIVSPAIRPTIIAVGCSPILFGAVATFHHWNLLKLAASCAAYGTCVLLLSVRFVMTPAERKRFGGAIVRRVRRKPARTHAPAEPARAGHSPGDPPELETTSSISTAE